MVNSDDNNLLVDDIIKMVKQEVKDRVNRTKDTTVDVVDSYDKDRFIKKDIYTYSDFTKYYGETFIKNLYLGLLGREVDDTGLKYYLELLQNGEKTKNEIVSLLRYSKEGKKRSVKLLGSKKRYILALLYRLPIVGNFIKSLVTLFMIPTLVKRLNIYENHIAQEFETNTKERVLLQEAINTKADKTIKEELKTLIDTKIDIQSAKATTQELQTLIDTKIDIQSAKATTQELQNSIKHLTQIKADKQQVDTYLKTLDYIKLYMQTSQQKMQQLIDEAKKRLPAQTLTTDELLAITDEQNHKFDTLYVEFEDKFRGTRADVKSRVEVYLPYLERLSQIKDNIEILDLGCGRGEWLELLKDNGYKNIKGIDLNRVMVSLCKKIELDTIEVDVIKYLKSLEDETLSVITGFHIIEHLPFEILMSMYKESLRVLKKGGIVIFETPNPENILVGAHYFYTDPTHINPLVPVTTQFLLQQSGFKDVEIKRLHKFSQYYQTQEADEFIDTNFYNEMDYAVIGYKR